MVEIRDKQEVLLSGDANVFRQELSTVLQCMREELDDHRLAINESNDELSASSEFVNELSRKIDKIAERVDELTLLIKGRREERQFSIQPLSSKEKEVFQVVYAVTEHQPYVSYDQLSRRAKMSRCSVMDHITSMMNKGVPIVKKLDNSTVFLKLDEKFRELQAKKNLVGLNSLLTAWVQR